MSNEELLIVQRAQKGDPLAFARLHDRYFSIIYQFFFYRIGDENLINELTTGLFDRMVKRIHTYKAESMKFLPWLYMLAKSLMMETLLERGLTYEKAAQLPAESQPGVPSSAHQTKFLLAQLPSEMRDVIVGKLIEGRTTRDVAREIGRSAAAVKSLRRQGLQQLQRIFAQGDQP